MQLPQTCLSSFMPMIVESPIVAETASSSDHAGASIARWRKNSGTAARRVNESVQPWIVPVIAINAIHDWTSATPFGKSGFAC